MAVALLLILTPIIWNGAKAFIFKGTIEYRQVMLDHFDRGNAEKIEEQTARSDAARAPIYNMMETFEADMKALPLLSAEHIDRTTAS